MIKMMTKEKLLNNPNPNKSPKLGRCGLRKLYFSLRFKLASLIIFGDF